MAKFSVLVAGVAVVAAVSIVAPGASSAAPAAKKQITVTAVGQSMYYGGSEPALSYAVTGLAKGDSLTRKPTCSVPSHHAVGRYVISCSGAAANTAKYTIRYVSAYFYVGKATLTIAADYRHKYYADADPTTFTYTTAGLVAGDKITTAPTCGVDGPHTDAGRYVINCSGADAGPNYAIRYLAQYYDIAKSPVLLGPLAQYVYYGGQDPEFAYRTYGLKSGEKLTTEPTCGVDGEHEHVGTYTIRCTGAQATKNYNLTALDNQFAVLQAPSYVVGERPVYRNGLLGPTSGKLVATLYVALGQKYDVYPGATVVFSADDTTLCTAVTDSAGQATCSLNTNAAKIVKQGGYTVTYAGNDDIAGSHHDVDNG